MKSVLVGRVRGEKMTGAPALQQRESRTTKFIEQSRKKNEGGPASNYTQKVCCWLLAWLAGLLSGRLTLEPTKTTKQVLWKTKKKKRKSLESVSKVVMVFLYIKMWLKIVVDHLRSK